MGAVHSPGTSPPRLRRLGLAAAPLLVAVGLGLAVAGPAAAISVKPCADAVGAHFSFTLPGGKKVSGDHYRVTSSVACASSDTWVSKLTNATPGARQADGGNLLKGGPAGWKCEGKSYTDTRHSPPTISGDCYKGSLIQPAAFFQWGIDTTPH